MRKNLQSIYDLEKGIWGKTGEIWGNLFVFHIYLEIIILKYMSINTSY